MIKRPEEITGLPLTGPVLLAHEHAVAKRAVEVLRLFEAPTGNYKRVEAEALAALREIDASGWQP